MRQIKLFDYAEQAPNTYRLYLTAVENSKGVLDVDTVKGCALGMDAYPLGGCYGECYAYKTASRYGLDFTVSVPRKIYRSNRENVYMAVACHKSSWYRIGVAGDPCHDWNNTIKVIEFLRRTGKTAVIVTKHWIALSDDQLIFLSGLPVVVNTSISALDTDVELNHRIEQIGRLNYAGIKNVARVVTCKFGDTGWARERDKIQGYLLSFKGAIDTPLRLSKSNKYVARGDIKLTGLAGRGGRFISLHRDDIHTGICGECPDKCGTDHAKGDSENE